MKSQFHPQQQPPPFYANMNNVQSQYMNSGIQQMMPGMASGIAPSQMMQGTQQLNTNSGGKFNGTMGQMNGGRVSRVNWQNINSLDIDEIKKANDIETLESFLPNMLESTVSQKEYEQLKPEALVKLLQICQLSLQYFDYTQDYLENLTQETQDEINKLLKKAEDDKTSLKKSKKEIEQMKNEIGVKKEAIKKYKEFLKQRPQYKCHICINKNEEYLDSHMKRRHQSVLPMNANHPNFAVMQNMVFAQQLQQERQEFERQQKVLLNSEKYKKDDILDKLELVLQKNRQEQLELQLEMQKRLRDMEQQQAKIILNKEEENDFQKKQVLEMMKNMNQIHNEVSVLKEREVVVEGKPPEKGKVQELYLQQSNLLEEQNKQLIEKRKQIKQQQEDEAQEDERKKEQIEKVRLQKEKEKKERLKQERLKAEEEERKRKKEMKDKLENERKVIGLIGEDAYQDQFDKRPKAGREEQQKKRGEEMENKVPFEIKQATTQISGIRKVPNNQFLFDDGEKDLSDINIPDASGRNFPDNDAQKRNYANKNAPKPSDFQGIPDNEAQQRKQQVNKYNSIPNQLLEDQESPLKDKEDVPEEEQIDYDQSLQSAGSYQSQNSISEDRDFNNKLEEEKEQLDVSGKKASKKKKDILEGSSDDQNDRNRQEESSMNVDEQGFYNGSKGRSHGPQIESQQYKQSVSLGDSYQEQLNSKKINPSKQRKKFDFEESGSFEIDE